MVSVENGVLAPRSEAQSPARITACKGIIILEDLNGIQKVWWILHGNLVGSISSHHVLYRQLSARVVVEPCIQLQDSSMGDDDRRASSDEVLDLRSGVHFAFSHDGHATRSWGLLNSVRRDNAECADEG